MNEKGDAAKAVTRNLHAAIERVREDVAKVEFWADAVSGFSQPVPEYEIQRREGLAAGGAGQDARQQSACNGRCPSNKAVDRERHSDQSRSNCAGQTRIGIST